MSVLNTCISYFNSIYSSDSRIVNIGEILNDILIGTHEDIIGKIRNCNDQSVIDKLKKQLPAVTVSATFSKNRNSREFLSYSGLMQVDLDKVSNLQQTKQLLEADPHTLAVFLSPSGTGLKLIICVPQIAEEHAKIFRCLETYYFIRYRLSIDPSCKDVSRLMFLSFDPEIFVNDKSILFDDKVVSEVELQFFSAVKKTNRHSNFITSNRNNYIFKLACCCKEAKLPLANCLDYCLSFAEPDFLKDEIQTTVYSAYRSQSEQPGKTLSMSSTPPEGLLLFRTAEKCMVDASSQPVPTMLFSQFWHERELCILFADTGVGKSLLAVQIAQSIASGKAIRGFKLETQPQPVIYLDFELADKQFQKRYSVDYQSNYNFHPNLKRVTINPNYTEFENFEEELFGKLEASISDFDCRVVIVDNISFLKAESTEKSKDAMPLMKRLVALKRRLDVSLLVLGHTPKRDPRTEITLNHLGGSKHLSNFCDSIFTIGVSATDPSLRYLKHLKARTTENFYGSDNVILCSVEKDFNFLGFNFQGYDYEQKHLKVIPEDEKQVLEQNIIQLHQSEPELSLQEIANRVGTYKMKVKRILDKWNRGQSL